LKYITEIALTTPTRWLIGLQSMFIMANVSGKLRVCCIGKVLFALTH